MSDMLNQFWGKWFLSLFFMALKKPIWITVSVFSLVSLLFACLDLVWLLNFVVRPVEMNARRLLVRRLLAGLSHPS